MYQNLSLMGGSSGTFGPSDAASIVQSLRGGTDDGLLFNDTIGVLDEPSVVDRPVPTFDGAGDRVQSVTSFAVGNNLDIEIDAFFGSGGATYSEPFVIGTDVNAAGAFAFERDVLLSNQGVLILYPIGAPSRSAIPIITGELWNDARHTLRVTYSDGAYAVYVDGTLKASDSITNYSGFTNAKKLGIFGRVDGVSARYLEGSLYNVKFSCDATSLEWPLEELSGDTCYDVSGNGNHGTITTTSGIETMRSGRADGVPSYVAQYGFTDSAGVQIPALLDGTADATGGSITNPGGVTHNGGSYNLLQTDAYFEGGTVSFYSADGTTADRKTYADMLAHYTSANGAYNLWLKLVSPSVLRADQYPLDKDWTPSEITRNETFYGGGGAALRDVDGVLLTDVNGYVLIAGE
jgi:hypothetical protein